jgi:hypothetical protein
VASGETETSNPDLSCNKRVHREDTSGDLGRAREDHQSSRLEVIEGEGRTEELVRPEVSTGVLSGSAAAAEVGLARAGEANLTKIAAPPPAAGEAIAREVITTDTSSDPLKDPSPLGRQGVNVTKLLRLPTPQPRALQGR